MFPSPKRILFITEGGLGDQVALTPAIRAAKESFPNAFVCVFATYRQPIAAEKRNQFLDLYPSPHELEKSVLATNPNIDELYVLNRYAFKTLSPVERLKAELRVVRFFRRKKFDTIISTFPHKDRFILWAMAFGARNRVSARNQGLYWLLTHAPDIEKARGGVVEYYCDLVRAIGGNVQSTRTEYRVPKEASEWADHELQQAGIQSSEKFVAVHPGASGSYKVWPPDRYAELISYIHKNHHLRIVLLKGEMDNAIVEAMKPQAPFPIIEIDCREKVSYLAAVLQRSALCISNDSGPRHLAVAVRTPSLAFFRHHHDKEWDVYHDVENCVTLKGEDACPVCPGNKCFDRVPEGEHYGALCVRQITTERAIRQVDAMLKM